MMGCNPQQTFQVSTNFFSQAHTALNAATTARRPRGLFDYLVGAGEQCRRYVEAEGLGGLEVDNKFKLGRELYRQVGRGPPALFALWQVGARRQPPWLSLGSFFTEGPLTIPVDNRACTIFKGYEAKYPLRLEGPKMPIRAVIEDAGAFTPEEAAVLISAFESTLQKIGLAKREDQLSLVIAKRIIAIARSGERDPQKLSASVIAELELEAKGKVGVTGS